MLLRKANPRSLRSCSMCTTTISKSSALMTWQRCSSSTNSRCAVSLSASPCAALWSISTRSACSTHSAYLSKATKALPRSRLMLALVVSPTLSASLLSTPIRPQRRCASKCASSAINHRPSKALKSQRRLSRLSRATKLTYSHKQTFESGTSSTG